MDWCSLSFVWLGVLLLFGSVAGWFIAIRIVQSKSLEDIPFAGVAIGTLVAIVALFIEFQIWLFVTERFCS